MYGSLKTFYKASKKKLEPELGNTDAEIVRNIILSWLSEKSLISTNAKRKLDL